MTTTKTLETKATPEVRTARIVRPTIIYPRSCSIPCPIWLSTRFVQLRIRIWEISRTSYPLLIYPNPNWISVELLTFTISNFRFYIPTFFVYHIFYVLHIYFTSDIVSDILFCSIDIVDDVGRVKYKIRNKVFQNGVNEILVDCLWSSAADSVLVPD